MLLSLNSAETDGPEGTVEPPSLPLPLPKEAAASIGLILAADKDTCRARTFDIGKPSLQLYAAWRGEEGGGGREAATLACASPPTKCRQQLHVKPLRSRLEQVCVDEQIF